MKIGILSDIHGNAIALQAVLECAKEYGVERLLILGDFIGYYPMPLETMELLDEWTFEAIRGNHEVILERYLQWDVESKIEIDRKYGPGHLVASRELSSAQLSTLFSLPDQRVVNFGKKVVCQLNHGSPRNPDEYVYPDAEIQLLDSFADQKFCFVFMGHTHYPLSHRTGKTLLINPGSVGQARTRGGYADWGIVDACSGEYTQIATPYSIAKLVNVLSKYPEVPEYLINVLYRKNQA